MHEVILHNYDASPFAEKIRLIMGYKQLSWRWVDIPRIMPKPDLTALTGGYRKTPVLQIGADVYCDTALIARRLEAEKAMPSLFPEGLEFISSSFALWVDTVVFQHAVALAFQPEAMALRMAKLPAAAQQAFMADRAGLFSGGSSTRLSLAQAQLQWPVMMGRLQEQLSRADGEYLFGLPSIADFSLAHCLWFVKSAAFTAPLVDDYPEVAAWLSRVLGFGHGAHSPMSGEEALAIARASEPAALPDAPALAVQGIAPGQQVSIAATDYGVDPVLGELVHAGSEELVIRREDERAGLLHVHFPRIGFKIEAC
jgi:glutathione S-transferase